MGLSDSLCFLSGAAVASHGDTSQPWWNITQFLIRDLQLLRYLGSLLLFMGLFPPKLLCKINLRPSLLKMNLTLLTALSLFTISAGEKVPVDGVVVSGLASTDESLLTGESRMVGKAPGSRVTGGTVCYEGVLDIQATATGSDSTLAGESWGEKAV